MVVCLLWQLQLSMISPHIKRIFQKRLRSLGYRYYTTIFQRMQEARKNVHKIVTAYPIFFHPCRFPS